MDTITDSDLAIRQAASQRGFYRALAGGSEGSRLLEPAPGVQATIVPARPWFSIFNSVLYTDGGAVAQALPRLAEAYHDAGSRAWTVWVPPSDGATAAELEAAGHVLDSTPLCMGASIAEVDLEPRRDVGLHPEPTWAMVARCNDRAHGVLEDWSMAAVFETMSDRASHLYAARDGEEVTAALIAREEAGDCYLWFVASVPEARGQGLASELVRVALREAKGRGCDTATLESTAMAESTYAALGYRPLGRYEMWERREA